MKRTKEVEFEAIRSRSGLVPRPGRRFLGVLLGTLFLAGSSLLVSAGPQAPYQPPQLFTHARFHDLDVPSPDTTKKVDVNLEWTGMTGADPDWTPLTLKDSGGGLDNKATAGSVLAHDDPLTGPAGALRLRITLDNLVEVVPATTPKTFTKFIRVISVPGTNGHIYDAVFSLKNNGATPAVLVLKWWVFYQPTSGVALPSAVVEGQVNVQ